MDIIKLTPAQRRVLLGGVEHPEGRIFAEARTVRCLVDKGLAYDIGSGGYHGIDSPPPVLLTYITDLGRAAVTDEEVPFLG